MYPSNARGIVKKTTKMYLRPDRWVKMSLFP